MKSQVIIILLNIGCIEAVNKHNAKFNDNDEKIIDIILEYLAVII